MRFLFLFFYLVFVLADMTVVASVHLPIFSSVQAYYVAGLMTGAYAFAPCSFFVFSALCVLMSSFVYAWSLPATIILYTVVACVILRYRHTVHANVFALSVVAVCVVAFCQWVLSGNSWTIWNFLGTLLITPVMVKCLT